MKRFLLLSVLFVFISLLFLGCEAKTQEKKASSQEAPSLSYTEKATKGSTSAMVVYIALNDKESSQSEVKSLCKEILKEKGASNLRIFIYDDIKYTPSSLPVPDSLDAWLYLYAYNKNTGLDALDKIK